MKEPYDRILFPQTVKCTGCGDALPPAITCWMVNGHINCTDCKDKVVARETERRVGEHITNFHKAFGAPSASCNSGINIDEFPSELDID